VSYSSGPRFPAKVGSGIATCLMTVCGLRASSIKKGLADLPMRLDSHISKARLRISMEPDTRAIMAYKTCGQATPLIPVQCADMRLLCCASPVNYSQDTATVQGNSTGWCHATDRVRRGRATRPDAPTLLKISFAIPSHQCPTI
jgi:hypothetical protein